jgi:hypothetical protein
MPFQYGPSTMKCEITGKNIGKNIGKNDCSQLIQEK